MQENVFVYQRQFVDGRHGVHVVIDVDLQALFVDHLTFARSGRARLRHLFAQRERRFAHKPENSRAVAVT